MDKILAFIYEKSHVEDLLSNARAHMEKNEVTLVTMGISLPPSNIVCRDFREYVPKSYEEVAMRKAQSWIKKWTNEKIVDGKSFKELISYDDVSLWWFVEFYHFYTQNMWHITRYIEIIKETVTKEKPTQVLLVRDDSLFSKVLEAFAKANSLKVLEVQQKPSMVSNLSFSFRNFMLAQFKKKWKPLLTLKETSRSTWLNLLNSLLSEKRNKTSELRTIVLITPERFWRSIIEPNGGKTRKGFLLTDSIIRKLASQYRLVLVSVDPFFDKILGLKILLEEKRAYPNVIIKTPVTWENKTVKDDVKRIKKKLDETWLTLRDSEEFQSSLTYEGIPLWTVLQGAFSDMFRIALPEAVRWIEVMKVMIDTEQPQAIILPGEYCSFLGHASITAGKKREVPTIAIQHGIISSNSLEYTFAPNEKGKDVNSKMWNTPSKLAVYGEYSKKALEKIRYPREIIEITGHPDYDLLSKLEKLLDKQEILREIGVNSNQKTIITLTTQALWSMKQREELFYPVLNAMKKLDNIILLVKPHPRENENWHKNIVKEMNVTNAIVLSSNYSTPKALFICDLMITSSSTTALEAIALDKPVITMNFTDDEEPYPYAESGATMGVYKTEDLLGAIVNVLENEKLRAKMKENRRSFISEQLYKTDGLASERIVNLISQLANSHSD